ncbi:MAG: transposase [Endomicrobium sp.]|nr:transposase [Endomicrobium sp.]
MKEAIQAAFPKSDHQKCIVHQVRHSTVHVTSKDLKVVRSDLRAIYTSTTQEL